MMKRLSRLLALSALLSMIFGGPLSRAQTPAVPARVAGPVLEQSRVRVEGNVPAIVLAQNDRGEASGSIQLRHMRVVLTRSAAQQTALDRFEQELQDKSTPNHHQWLTPEEFGRRYGPADSDIAAAVA